MPAARYFDLVREMRAAYNHRLRLVHCARREGLKPAARTFATTARTVRKWLRRYQQHGLSGLREHSRAHHHCPHKTSPELEQQVLALRRKLHTFGAARLKREFDLPLSRMTMQRIWRQCSSRSSADTKDLWDIPQFWPQAQQLELPLVQYTAREVRSGLLFWAFAQ